MSAINTAIRMETDAIKFYEEAAGKCEHPFGKKMFLSFVEDERRHLDMLNKIFKTADVVIKTGEPTEEIRTVFQTLKDETMERITATSDEKNAIKIAMDMEKEGFDFYVKAASETEGDKENALFERLAYEENKHYKILANTSAFLNDTGNWFMWEEYSIVEG
ncbi:putative trifunctional 2-polyprenylphenol hydroxylase/glutamate synthase subunit beta/ferritin domain-containing protein [bacterium BMS3Abin07]|nr:putative trifunctional 2-polyprenylphenol hydroxylase/glutamate synthase subunit beta/ferritin domain-containing protein [bacterium BMS3Abin07]GBE32939.1 putative trifunctional 2-polyprenylphenol hydroxylase/glutamate synthase subunit beta/ferritin domain-containing protein [bacterium BMS3Bbin05]HDL20044.1 rubrerythrin [Nitrospirota bacterium]HDO23070.1 rubrerythrin [Nitrospirota bacterium]HDZ87753.1 rubrerythrin [Nitrospirota bacterium]